MSIIAAAFCHPAAAQTLFDFEFPFQRQERRATQEKALQFDYDVDFQYLFDNREFSSAGDAYTSSMTINAARLTPSAGLRIEQNEKLTHRLMLGIDVMKNMGQGSTVIAPEGENLDNWQLFKEITLYYNARARLDKGEFEAYAGVFPRSASEGEYSKAFLSDSLRFYDNNLEGMLLIWRTPRLYSELGCDWMGQKGTSRRERFQIFSAGGYSATEWLRLGWSASIYHFAGSVLTPGVVDNALVNPYLRFDFSALTGMDALSLKGGALAGYQWDREFDEEVHIPWGFESVQTVQKKAFGLENTLYLGKNLMYYYDAAPYVKYGSDLYRGSPFYRTEGGWYDRAEIYFAPRISTFLTLRVSAVLHFADERGFQGWQQRASLVFDLDALRHPRTPLKTKVIKIKGYSL